MQFKDKMIKKYKNSVQFYLLLKFKNLKDVRERIQGQFRRQINEPPKHLKTQRIRFPITNRMSSSLTTQS